jgi:D-beta-D-heptose 7-phosphate kinase/D-beta-D-heptose 1-phosphate adenosyltransferase
MVIPPMKHDHRRLIALIRQLDCCSVAVIGDVMLDRYARGRVDRLSPEAPIQVLEVMEEEELPGGAANVASKIGGLGSRVRVVGLLGADEASGRLRRLLEDAGSTTSGLVVDPTRRCTVKTRFVAHNQQLLRVDRELRAAPGPQVRDRLARAAYEAASAADAVILEDYGKGVLDCEVIEAALAGARVRRAPVVVDPNGRDYRRYAGATVLTPNLREAEIAAERPIVTEADLETVATHLVEQTEGAALAVTRDVRGISLFRRVNGTMVTTHVPTVPVDVYDVTGAGDAVAATIAIALASEIDLVDACALANLAGRAVVRQPGVGTLSTRRLLDEATVTAETPTKILDINQAIQRVRRTRCKGGRIVFTNGCFDILHYGHAHLLQFARAQGDLLIVGLNTDNSVRRLKGGDRPFVDEKTRSTMLSLYSFVDAVVLFDEDTPLRLIEVLAPDVLVKGGDYSPEKVVGREVVEARGGQVVICPRLEGLSTTDLVRRIQERRVLVGA